MTGTEIALILTTIMTVVGGIAVIIRDHRKTRMDSDTVRAQVKELTDKSSARRDMRVLQLENWAFDKVRPWGREVVVKYDRQNDTLAEMAKALNISFVPDHLPPFPEMPPPLAPEK